MAEEAVEQEPVAAENEAGLVFHEGTRLTDLKLQQNLSIDYPRLEPLHHIKVELLFHYYKIRTTWQVSYWVTLAIGCFAVLLSGWDFGIGELSSGGDFHAIGVDPGDPDSGIRQVSGAAVGLTLITLGLWLILLVRLWSHFPLMRSQAISLYVALFAAQVSQFWAHGFDANFPLGFDSFAIAVAVVGLILIVFVGFILQRAVIETRDVHVEERHWHPDPRQMEIAMRDHSLFAWGAALFAYCVLVIIQAWAGAHYVSVRQPGEISGWWLLKILHIFTGFGIVWLMLHVLWYPQVMLGGGEMRIESDRAREVSSSSPAGDSSAGPAPSRPGECPDCGEETAVMMRASGEIEASCGVGGCGGGGVPGEKCRECGERISSRVICAACHTSAPVADHFSDSEAW